MVFLLGFYSKPTFSSAPYRTAISDSFSLSSQQIQSKTVAQCVEYYYSWKKEHKLASTLAQVSGKKIKTCQEGQGTGKRGQKPAGELCETPLCQEHVVPRPGEGAADAAQGFIVLLL